MENEFWISVLGYENIYEVSNFGRVRNISKFNNRILKPTKSKDGYLYHELSFNYVRHYKKIHRIVAESFLGKHEFKCVNHIDGNKLNNSILNLEWISTRENCVHRSLMFKKSSKYPNVTWDKEHSKWRAQVYINGKQKYIGIFEDEEQAYQKLCLFLHDKGIKNKYV
jgi:hypothetical protein